MSETKRRPGGHPGMRGPGVPGEKAKDFRGSLGKLIRPSIRSFASRFWATWQASLSA